MFLREHNRHRKYLESKSLTANRSPGTDPKLIAATKLAVFYPHGATKPSRCQYLQEVHASSNEKQTCRQNVASAFIRVKLLIQAWFTPPTTSQTKRGELRVSILPFSEPRQSSRPRPLGNRRYARPTPPALLCWCPADAAAAAAGQLSADLAHEFHPRQANYVFGKADGLPRPVTFLSGRLRGTYREVWDRSGCEKSVNYLVW